MTSSTMLNTGGERGHPVLCLSLQEAMQFLMMKYASWKVFSDDLYQVEEVFSIPKLLSFYYNWVFDFFRCLHK